MVKRTDKWTFGHEQVVILKHRRCTGNANAELAALHRGAGLVNYVGHSHVRQWAVTAGSVTPSYLLGLYDVDALANGDRLPIVLEMTCLTSAFQ